jgi:nucleoid-associated protein YgaU
MKKRYIYKLLITIPFMIFLSCQLDVPIGEMVSARAAINRAYEVRADRYAPDLLKKAEQYLYQSHEACKNEKTDQGKELALSSKKDADAAIEKALPLLAADSLKEAGKSLAEADRLYAEKYAADDFSKARELLQKAEELNTTKDFWASHLKSLESIISSNKAIDTSGQQIASLSSKAASLKAEADGLKNGETDQTILNDLALTDELIKAAEGDIRNRDIKPAVQRLSDAEAKLSSVKTAREKNELLKRVALLRNDTETLKKERGGDFAGETLQSITAALNEADALLARGDLKTAGSKADEAEDKLAAAREKIQEGLAAEKLASAEKLRASIAARDPQNRFQKELDSASAKISESKTLLEQKSYSASMAKSSEVEADLNALSINIEKTYAVKEETVTPVAPEEKTAIDKPEEKKTAERIYVVEYHKKNTDCLWRISEKVYKNPRLWPRIYMANKDQIKDPDLIFPGQRFVIPAIDESVAEDKKTEKEKTADQPAVKPENEKKSPDEKEVSEKKDTENKSGADVPEGIFPESK